MGIEPMSESISNGISPSAAFVLKFRIIGRPKAGCQVSYPVSPLRCFKAEMLDVIGVDIEATLQKAKEDIDKELGQ